MSFVLSQDNQKCQRMDFKNDVITIARFLGHCTAKIKDIGFKFYTYVGITQLCNMYSGFWDIYKYFDFWALLLKNQNFDFWWSKNKKKIQNNHFVTDGLYEWRQNLIHASNCNLHYGETIIDIDQLLFIVHTQHSVTLRFDHCGSCHPHVR